MIISRHPPPREEMKRFGLIFCWVFYLCTEITLLINCTKKKSRRSQRFLFLISFAGRVPRLFLSSFLFKPHSSCIIIFLPSFFSVTPLPWGGVPAPRSPAALRPPARRVPPPHSAPVLQPSLWLSPYPCLHHSAAPAPTPVGSSVALLKAQLLLLLLDPLPGAALDPPPTAPPPLWRAKTAAS